METEAEMTLRTDNEDKRAANWTAVERTVRDNDSITRDSETMIANPMELNHFRATAEAHASDETIKNVPWNRIEWNVDGARARADEVDCGAQLNAGKDHERWELELRRRKLNSECELIARRHNECGNKEQWARMQRRCSYYWTCESETETMGLTDKYVEAATLEILI